MYKYFVNLNNLFHNFNYLPQPRSNTSYKFNNLIYDTRINFKILHITKAIFVTSYCNWNLLFKVRSLPCSTLDLRNVAFPWRFSDDLNFRNWSWKTKFAISKTYLVNKVSTSPYKIISKFKWEDLYVTINCWKVCIWYNTIGVE